MIITVTLNPAIDQTVEIENFETDKVNRISNSRRDVGGKGINVSKVLKELGEDSKAIGFLAGQNGEYIKNYLEKIKVKSEFLFVEGETRTNLKVVDRCLKTNTDINEAGIEIQSIDIEKLKEIVSNLSNPDNTIIFAGSIPKNLSNKIYFELINLAKSKGAKTILDADGELFVEGIKAQPYMVKPNNYELEKLFGNELSNLEEVKNSAKKLIDMGIDKVVVSLGGEGALFLDKKEIFHANGLKVEVRSTVGAGDSMVAALAISEEKKLSQEEMIKLTIATSAASVTTSGTQVPSRELIDSLKNKVKFEIIK